MKKPILTQTSHPCLTSVPWLSYQDLKKHQNSSRSGKNVSECFLIISRGLHFGFLTDIKHFFEVGHGGLVFVLPSD